MELMPDPLSHPLVLPIFGNEKPGPIIFRLLSLHNITYLLAAQDTLPTGALVTARRPSHWQGNVRVHIQNSLCEQ